VELALSILGWTTFVLLILTGLVLDLIGLFGNWVILVAIGGLWAFTGFEHFGWIALVLMLGLAVLGEVLETAFSGFGASRFGGGRGAMVAAVVGCIGGAMFGTPIFPIIGTVIGACVGAFGAAALYEYVQMEKSVQDAAWTGFGAALGKVAGMLAKSFCGLGILAVAYVTY
jgi:uncharacterized protein YqgC (DUF456 family)